MNIYILVSHTDRRNANEILIFKYSDMYIRWCTIRYGVHNELLYEHGVHNELLYEQCIISDFYTIENNKFIKKTIRPIGYDIIDYDIIMQTNDEDEFDQYVNDYKLVNNL